MESDLPTWDILDRFFNQSGGADSANTLVRHQIESINEFLDKKLIQIIQGFNPIQVYHNYSPEFHDFKYKINLNIIQPSLSKPMYQAIDGAQMLMTPNLARMNNLTYSGNLYVDVHAITEIINDDGVTERKETNIPNVCIGKIPIMARSKACVLTQVPGINEGECRYDFGGYFIINGNEKVVISQDRISENKTLIFAPNGNGDGISAEIRSMPDGMFLPPKTTNLHLSGKSNHMGNVIRLNASFLRSEVPLFVMFRALGIESDKEIYAHVVHDIDAKKHQRILSQLAACSEDACDIHTQNDALVYLLKVLGTTGTPKEYLEQQEKAIQILKNTIKNDFLSHTGPCFRKKALYLGFMVKKLLSIHLGYQNYDNRDSYLHKRIDTPGILFGNLFRQCYGKMIKEVRNLIVRELNLWRANPNIPLQLITPNNVHRFFKQNIIETGLRYALSTGNWGIKSIGSFQNIRQGVAQMYNRMSYLSSLSHLRRINTPMEKNGKLVQPRKLENTQCGMICPSECFAPNTPILLWNGTIKKAEDIIVGDYLIDDNGNPIRVKTTCSGFKTMYDIIPTKKNFMSYTVTDNHILTLKARNHIRNPSGRNKNYKFRWFDAKKLEYTCNSFETTEELESFKSSITDVIDITIEKYLSLDTNVQKELYTFKSSGINWEFKEVALDPYILGMWLGDGLSNGYNFATADKELLDKWIEWGVDNDATIKKGLKYKYNISSTINNTQEGIACNKTEQAPLAKLLRVYNLVNNKHIPLDYIVNDRKTRLAVLAGIIDTDGNVRANGHEIRICQGEPNYRIIYDTEFLARSLGFSCHLNNGIASYTVNGEKRKTPYKELTITGQYLYEIPTVLPRKKLNKFENPTSVKRCSSFMQSSFQLIQKDVQPFVGWQVDGNGRFLSADLTVIHNTPEGAAVGLVKNMAMSTHITVNISSAYIRQMVQELGTFMYSDNVVNPIDYLKKMGSEEVVIIIVNGDIIGYHTDPVKFYSIFKHMKRHGSIPPMTSIVWDVQQNTITISTEAGRMCRPLYIVKDSKVELTNVLNRSGKTWKEYAKDKTFDYFIAPMEDDAAEGFIEFLDVDEIDKSMIAMFPNALTKGIKGHTMPPKYTHCEIDPSLMNGVLAGNIPFPDRNQAPRNCYQCLWVEEKVLMTNGMTKEIKNIEIGDEVMTFNPDTKIISNTKVIHQYIRPALKPIYRIFTISGRFIVVTQDHKFMTNQGWCDSYGFRNDTKIGIYMYPKPIDKMNNDIENIHIDDSNTNIRLSEMELIPLKSNKIPVVARLVGYIHSNKTVGFKNYRDQARFEDDVKSLGFNENGYRDSAFLLYMKALGAFEEDIIPEWIINSNKNIKREYIRGFLSVGDMKGITHKLMDEVGKWNNLSEYMETFGGYAYNYEANMDAVKKAEYYKYLKHKKNNPTMSEDEWDKIVEISGDILFVPFEKSEQMRNVMVADITVESDNHSFIGGDGFAVSNSAMGKQAIGVYMSNYSQRIDTMAHILHYPQKPLVSTKLSKYTYINKLPCGINAIVAIMTMTGFNQEDSVMLNESAIDRGLFTSTYYKSYRDQCTKNHSTGEEEVFTKPIIDTSGRVKPFNYDKLGEDGFIPKNTPVGSNDILVGKVMPYKSQGVQCARDTSMQIKGNDEGHVDFNYTGINGEGYRFCKVRIRKYRKPTIGDKAASRSAQKGSIGMVYKQQDMPFTKSGITPDIIMNPHAIPSRMTMGQLMECIMGKAGCELGAYGDATPFNNCSVEDISKILEKFKYERYGNEILYNGRTGEQVKTEIFIGPTYYQRLKHMVADKSHCFLQNRTVLCKDGWKMIQDVKITDYVAVLEDGKLVYEHPEAVLKFDYSGDMYHISNQAIDLDVTINHKMYVSFPETRKRIWSEYKLVEAGKLFGKHVKYKKDCDRNEEDYQFTLPAIEGYEDIKPNMNAWLTFFGIWMAEGWAHTGYDTRYRIEFAINKQRVKDVLFKAINNIGYSYSIYDEKLSIHDKQLHAYMVKLSVGAPNKRLPEWCFELSKIQSQKLIHAMQLGDGTFRDTSSVYYTASIGLADDFQKLCIHAGWTGNIMKHLEAGNKNIIRGKEITTNYDIWRISVIKTKTNPSVNHGHHKTQDVQKEYIYHYEGPVYCLTVSTGVFMIRHNGKAVWTGNSRGSNGPIIMLTRQPAEGRARNGGLRFGEMERDAIVGHGASAFLKERMMDVSDNFRVFICRKCGLICTANPEKNIYKCAFCKNNADITQVRIPYSMKLLLQELMTMSVALRIGV
jgi:DNA-directed RNA polymerase beta subunit